MEEERLENQPIESNEGPRSQVLRAPLEEKTTQEIPSEKEQTETSISEVEVKEAETVAEMPPGETAFPSRVPLSFISSLLQKAREKNRLKREKRLEKILELAKKKGEITNDDVEKLLHISDATATRYLSQLVKEGKLLRVGPPERAKYKIP